MEISESVFQCIEIKFKGTVAWDFWTLFFSYIGSTQSPDSQLSMEFFESKNLRSWNIENVFLYTEIFKSPCIET